MKNDVALINQFRRQRLIVDRIDRVVEPRLPLEMLNVLDLASRQIVDDVDVIAAL